MDYDFIKKLEKNDGYNESRLYTQIQYAKEVSDAESGKYDALIEKAVDKISTFYSENGAITLAAVKEFENDLEEMVPDCKKYELLMVGHAHIDMNWMWAYDETVAITLSTFGTMLKLMEEYPDFTFAQSQASVYRIVEEYDPEMLKEIKRRIKEGRWEVTASQWVEGDKNLASGEDLSRHLLQTRKYLSSLLDIEAKNLNIAYEPDTFGHNANMPEILSGGGVKYMYHCRGYRSDDLYYWKAPSGAKITVFCEPEWYIEVIGKKSFLGYVNRMKRWGITKYLRVYGVGDHGGGATRRDLNRIKDMQAWRIMPTLKFSHYSEFFEYIDSMKLSLNVVEGELNKVFTGCYTTQARIKKCNAEDGRILIETEKAMAMANMLADKNNSSTELDASWREHLFSQFHDILPGSCVMSTREYASAKSQELKAKCATEKTYALKSIAVALDTAKYIRKDKLSFNEGYSALAGQGTQMCSQIIDGETNTGSERLFLIYNPASTDGDYIVCLKLWDYDGDLDFLRVTDINGNGLAFDIDKNGVNDFIHIRNDLTVRVKIPALGYTVIRVADDNKYISCNKASGPKRLEYNPEYVLEDEFVRVEFDENSGAMLRLVDKLGNRVYENTDELAGFTYLTEAWNDITAWVQGKTLSETPLRAILCDSAADRQYKNGKAKKQIVCEMNFGVNSCLRTTVSLKNGVIEYASKVFFHEVDRNKKFIPTLRFDINANFNKFLYDIPYGVIERDSKDRFDEPALSFVCGLDTEGKGLMLQAEGKNGFKGKNGRMSVTLIRNTYNPDECPESCTHDIVIKIAPVAFTSKLALLQQAERQRASVCYLSVTPSNGALPLENSLASVSGALLTSLIPIGDGTYVARLSETDGKESVAKLCVNGMERAWLCDGIENESSELAVKDSCLAFTIKPYTVNTVKFKIR